MGFFNRKKQCSSLNSSPASSSATVVPSPVFPTDAHFRPNFHLTLRVAVDPPPVDSEDGIFTITVNSSDNVMAVRRAIRAKLGNIAIGLFKVSMPYQAYSQARAYSRRYGTAVNLITCFPSYNLDDSEQCAASFGMAWQSAGDKKANLTMGDWWPDAAALDVVSVLIRVGRGCSPDTITLTLQAHFAVEDASAKSASSSPTIKGPRRHPAVIDVSPQSTIKDLKTAVLEADGRLAGFHEHLVLWQVEMSEEEIVVIEERGGLRGGRMPWPYPPTAPEPIALSDANRPLSSYLPNALSNGRMIGLSVWIHPCATERLARLTVQEDAPTFKYPMILDDTTNSPSTPVQPPSTPSHSLPLPSRKIRPSTAPAAIVPPGGGRSAPAFGSRSKIGGLTRSRSKPRSTSRLSTMHNAPTDDNLGLGITVTTTTTITATESVLLEQRASVDSNFAESRAPSLDFETLHIGSDEPGIMTPEVTKADFLFSSIAPTLLSQKPALGLPALGLRVKYDLDVVNTTDNSACNHLTL